MGSTVQTLPTPDDQLTARDRLEIEYLAKVDIHEYDRRVNEWVSLGVDDGRRVFYAERLAARTYDALGRLIIESERRYSGRRGGAAKKDASSHYLMLVRERAHAKQVRAAMIAERTAASPRQKAYRALGELHRDDMRELFTRIKAGEQPNAVVADMRQRRA
jgi:hypothetical protein